MIRTLFFYVVLLASTMVHGIAAILAGIFRVKSRRVYDWGTQDWARWNLWAAGTPLDVQGMERVPRGTPVVYASNHSSMFDIWALSLVLPGSTRFVAKHELTRVPVMGPAMLRAGHVTIDRFNRKRAFEAYERAAATIKSGISTIVFPEGTRSRTGELRPVRAGDRRAGADRACVRAQHVPDHAQGGVAPAPAPHPHPHRRSDSHGRDDARRPRSPARQGARGHRGAARAR